MLKIIETTTLQNIDVKDLQTNEAIFLNVSEWASLVLRCF